ncbi:MAG: TIGR03067 domain-containing protein [Verrucomicrobiota bacterium]
MAHEGFWRATSAIMAGTPFDEAVTRSITVKIEGDRYETMVGAEVDRGDCIVDAATTPKRMTITGTDGPNKGMTYLAVYEMDDEDSLRICYDLSGKNYPDTFDATQENGYYTATYQRETPKPAEETSR